VWEGCGRLTECLTESEIAQELSSGSVFQISNSSCNVSENFKAFKHPCTKRILP